MNYEDRLFLASLLGLVLPGIGHLYIGFIRRGMIFLLFSFAITIGISIGQSNYNYNGNSFFGYLLLLISIFLWIAAAVWQLFDLRQTIKKRLPRRESKTPVEFKNLAIVIIGIIIFELVFLVVMDIGSISLAGASATGSMVPTINKNNIVFIQSVGGVGSTSFANLKRGDIISFKSPIGNESVIHRIVDIKLDNSGNRIIKTKGDANPFSAFGLDYPIRQQNYMGKVVYILPAIFGLFLNLIANPPFYPIIIASVIAVIFYFYKNKERKKVEEIWPEQQQQTMAIRRQQSASTAAAITIILVAILLVDSYVLINPYIPVSLGHNVGDLSRAKIAAIGDNNLYIIWNDYSVEGGKYDILLAKSSDGGNSFGKTINVSHNLGFSIYPAIATSPLRKNDLYVTWDDNSTGNYEIYFAKSTDGGNSFGKIVNISRNLGVSGRSSISAYSNNVYVVWNDNSTGNYEIYFAKSTDGGNSFGKSISLGNNTGKSFSPNIAVSTNNTLDVSWIGDANNIGLNGKLYFAKSTDGGNKFIQPVGLVREEKVFGVPAIAASGKTNLSIIWTANFTGNYKIHFTHSTDAGKTFSVPVNLADKNGLSSLSSPQTFPSENGLYVVWTRNGSPYSDIYFAKSTDVGNNFSDPINLSKNIDKESFRPYITASANNIYVVWTAASDRDHAIFFTKSTDHGNTFSDPINLSKKTE